MKKYITEFIGTFALVICGTGAIIVNQQTNGTLGVIRIALAFGTIISAMIYIFGNISGAHINLWFCQNNRLGFEIFIETFRLFIIP